MFAPILMLLIKTKQVKFNSINPKYKINNINIIKLHKMIIPVLLKINKLVNKLKKIKIQLIKYKFKIINKKMKF